MVIERLLARGSSTAVKPWFNYGKQSIVEYGGSVVPDEPWYKQPRCNHVVNILDVYYIWSYHD